ncbi:MAG: FHA domain-containing protein [Polyangiaceae bacterium]|nr:FHA domain-containing protein [Polyangiaceae bacterium]
MPTQIGLHDTPAGGAPLSARAVLDVIEPGMPRRQVLVPRTGLRAGRAPDAGLLLTAPTVSKRHAEFLWRGDDLWVRDEGSCNGTRRDGAVLRDATLLRDGDELVLGGSVMLRVAIDAGHIGAPATDLASTGGGLVPSQVPLDQTQEVVDLLPIVTRVYQASSYEEIGLQLTRAVGDSLRASRVALLEIVEGGERFRTLGLYKGARFDVRPLYDARFVSRTAVNEALARGVAYFTEGRTNLSKSIILAGAHSAMAAAIRPHDGRQFVLYADAIIGEPPLTGAHAHTLGLLAAHAAGAFDALDARLQSAHEQLRFDQLRRYFSPAVAELILNGGDELVAMPKQLEATVLFADLVGYTKLSERLRGEPARLLTLLNRWLDAGAQAVLDHEGTLDKFIGDCVMALFGAPFPQGNAELEAVRCAVAMRDAIARIGYETGEPLAITVGINTGWLLAGSVGSRRRLEYTVLGDTVNVGSRLQGQAVPGEILVGELTAARLAGAVPLEDAGVRTLKNHGPVHAHRVLAPVWAPGAAPAP